jgi:hypothetical protein
MRQLQALPHREFVNQKNKREMECALVKKSAICKEEGTKGKAMVPCLR